MYLRVPAAPTITESQGASHPNYYRVAERNSARCSRGIITDGAVIIYQVRVGKECTLY